MTSLIGDPSQVLAGIPDQLRKPLVDAFNEIVKNYRENRWEPSELNGGKLCEIVYTILKGHVDGAWPAGPSKPSNMYAACTALEQAGSAFPRSVRVQIPRALITLYEIRNNRNVGHVGSDVNPNHMDATLVLSMSKWVMSELVRIFHQVTTDEASQLVDTLSDRTVPLLWNVAGVTRVLSTTLSAKDKALAVLYGARGPKSAKDLLSAVEYGNASRFRGTVLKGAHKDGLIHFDERADTAHLSPLGEKYVEQNIPLTV